MESSVQSSARYRQQNNAIEAWTGRRSTPLITTAPRCATALRSWPSGTDAARRFRSLACAAPGSSLRCAQADPYRLLPGGLTRRPRARVHPRWLLADACEGNIPFRGRGTACARHRRRAHRDAAARLAPAATSPPRSSRRRVMRSPWLAGNLKDLGGDPQATYCRAGRQGDI